MKWAKGTMIKLNFDNTYLKLPEQFFARSQPATFPQPKLIAFNEELFHELGGSFSAPPTDEDLAFYFSGQKLMDGSDPIAMAYAGHQFGYFNPQMGDGRAILLGEVLNARGERVDIQLKGAGRTPFSRRGDGKSVLGPVLREYIVSESMHYLGVPTTRALAAVSTGEKVYRETVEPGGVFTRVASSHLRIGTLQYFLGQRDLVSLQTIIDYAIDRHYPHLQSHPQRYLEFFEAVADRLNDLVVKWLSLGFIHGVMNTDNTSLSGETLDYGPCAFMEAYHPETVFSFIDENGRYAFQQQPLVLQWNLARLADCLIPFVEVDQAKSIDRLNQALERSHHSIQNKYQKMICEKMGFTQATENHIAMALGWMQLMEKYRLDFTLGYVHLGKKLEDEASEFLPQTEDLQNFIKVWKAVHDGVGKEQAIAIMKKINPVFIPRNHLIQRAIDEALKGKELVTFNRLRQALKHPFDEIEGFADFYLPAQEGEEVTVTYCGT